MPTIKHRLVGTVSYRVGAKLPNGTIPLDMDDAWESQNIVRVDIPQLRGVDDGTSGGSNGIIRFHKRGAKQLQAAFAEIEAKGLKSKLLSFAGSYYPRMIRGATVTPSEHSFGTALDLNAAWNGLGRTPAKPGTKGSMHEIAPIFRKHGFDMGMDWTKRPDGMHVQIREWQEPVQAEPPKLVTVPAPTVEQVLINDILQVGAYKKDGEWWGRLRPFADAAKMKLQQVSRDGKGREHWSLYK